MRNIVIICGHIRLWKLNSIDVIARRRLLWRSGQSEPPEAKQSTILLFVGGCITLLLGFCYLNYFDGLRVSLSRTFFYAKISLYRNIFAGVHCTILRLVFSEIVAINVVVIVAAVGVAVVVKSFFRLLMVNRIHATHK